MSTRLMEKFEYSEALFKSIIAASPDIITSTDLEGNILLESPKAQAVFRYDPPKTRIGCNVLTDLVQRGLRV